MDSSMQPKAITNPEDGRLLEITRHKLLSITMRVGIKFKQPYAQEGKTLRGTGGHAMQFKRLRAVLKRQRTILG